MSALAAAQPAGLQLMELIRDGDLVMTDEAGRELVRATATCHVAAAPAPRLS
jgi:hypothetical protein